MNVNKQNKLGTDQVGALVIRPKISIGDPLYLKNRGCSSKNFWWSDKKNTLFLFSRVTIAIACYSMSYVLYGSGI